MAAAVSLLIGIVAGEQAAGEISLEFKIREWRREHGLPGDWIERVLPAGDGYVWIGTPESLLRFDGRGATEVLGLGAGGLPPACKALAEDSEGAIWVAAKRSGVFRIRRGVATRFGPEDGLADADTHSLSPCSGGGMWIGTSGGLSLFSGGAFRTFRQPGLGPSIGSVLEDSRGQVWVGTDQGLWRLEAKEDRFTRAWPVHGADSQPIPSEGVTCLWDGQESGLWVGTNDGAVHLEGGRPMRYRLGVNPEDNRVRAFFQDRSRRFWAVSGRSLYLFRGGRFEDAEGLLGLEDAIVRDIAEDREGNLWIASKYRGLIRARPAFASVLTRRDGLPHNDVWSVTPSAEGGVWVGTERGVARFREGRLTPLPWDGAAPSCRSLLEDSAGLLWVGAAFDSVLRRSAKHEAAPVRAVRAPHHQIQALLEDSRGRVWLGTKVGLGCYPPSAPHSGGLLDPAGKDSLFEAWIFRTGNTERVLGGEWWDLRGGRWLRRGHVDAKFTVQDLALLYPRDWREESLPQGAVAHDNITALAEGADGTIWIGTEGGGLNAFRGGKFTVMTPLSGALGDNVRALHSDGRGTLWIATVRGLAWLRDGHVFHFDQPGLREAHPIRQILSDDYQHLWLGTDSAIWRVAIAELEAAAAGSDGVIRPVRLDEADGLISPETRGGVQPSACKTPDGVLWFATSHGLARIDPSRVRIDLTPPPVHVEAIRSPALGLAGAAAGDGGFALPPGSGSFLEILYTAVNFSAPERVRFRYRLEGHDERWVEAGARRAAYYTNLKPGSYRFEVAACNHHGVWSEEGAVVSLEIRPFLHQTLAFRLGLGAVAAALAAWGIAWKMRILRLEQQAALSRERERIARDMHDDLGSRLNQIVLLSGAPWEASARPASSGIAEMARAAAQSLDEIVWSIHPGRDSLRSFAEYLGQYASEQLAPAGVDLRLDYPDPIPDLPLSAERRHQLFLAAKEVLRNTLRHASATRVSLRLGVRGDVCELEISDNGRGIAAADLPAGFSPAPRDSERGTVGGSARKLGGSLNPGLDLHEGECQTRRRRRKGHGLDNLGYRARAAGGRAHLETAPGEGTRVRLVFPLNSES